MLCQLGTQSSKSAFTWDFCFKIHSRPQTGIELENMQSLERGTLLKAENGLMHFSKSSVVPGQVTAISYVEINPCNYL